MTRRLALVALVVATAVTACGGASGGQPFAHHDHDAEAEATFERDEAATSIDEEADEPDEVDVEVATPTSYEVVGSLEFDDFALLVSGIVVDPEHYDLTYESEGLVLQVIRDGEVVYLARAADLEQLATRPFVQTDLTGGTAVGYLQEEAATGPTAEEGVAGADVAIDAFLELLLTDPTSLLDLDALAGGDEPEAIEVPDVLAGPIEALGLEPPPLEASIEVADGELALAELAIGGSVLEYRVAARYTEHGVPSIDRLDIPGPDEIDATPWVEEEELAAFTDAALLAPSAVPGDLVLIAAVVLAPEETVEGCAQVELDYTTPPDQPPGEEFLRFFLLPEACAAAVDPSSFDEAYAGFPARAGGTEILVDGTVVQIQASDLLAPDAVEAAVATFAPITAAELIAAVVPTG